MQAYIIEEWYTDDQAKKQKMFLADDLAAQKYCRRRAAAIGLAVSAVRLEIGAVYSVAFAGAPAGVESRPTPPRLCVGCGETVEGEEALRGWHIECERAW